MSRLPSASLRLPSLQAADHLPGQLASCSWQAGWRSLLLREYAEPAVSGPFTTLPCEDQLIVLVLEGPCDIRSRHGSSWKHARQEVGSIGMTRPGEEAQLEFSSARPGRTLQLHLPGATLRRVARELPNAGSGAPSLPSPLECRDELVRHTMLGLAAALEDGAPEPSAQTSPGLPGGH